MLRLQPGEIIGRYTIIRQLGEGNMGTVYEAVDQQSGQDVAIKMLRIDYVENESLATRFEREVMVVRLLDHPNIVPFLDYGQHEGKTYFVMALIRGVSLTTWLRSKFFNPLEVLALLEPLCGALDHAHASGVLHRDVKPSNILLDMTAEPPGLFLSDFGLSKVIGMISLTETQTQVGTPNYMSPEQVEDLPLTPATDVYSLAVVVYEMLLRQLPYEAHSDFEMTLAHVEQAPAPPSEVSPGFPPALESVLLRGLIKDPLDRYASAGEFYAGFYEALADLDDDERTRVYRYF
jgi:serine/threonine protein kinase